MPGPTAEQRALLMEWQEISGQQMARYARAWAAGQIDLADYERLFQAELRDLYVAAAWTSTGGPERTSQADYGRIGRQLRDQYGYMHQFFGEIAQGKLSLAEIEARGKLYTASSRQALEAVSAAGNEGLPRLPAQPGDGTTRCRTNCKCNWRIEAVENGYDCYWELNPAEHCEDCLRRAREWNPLRVRFGEIVEG